MMKQFTIDWKLFREQILRAWIQMTARKRILFISAPTLAMITFISAMNLSSSPKFQNLIIGEPEKNSEIATYLHSRGIEHYIPNATTIQVDERIKAKTIVELARQNLIGPNERRGYARFDNYSNEMSDERFRVIETRALEDTIARTIADGDSNIKNAYVRIARNPETIPSASVKLISSINPNKESVRGVQDLLSKAVGNLHPKNVIVVDNENNIISENTVEDQYASDVLQEQRYLQDKIKEMIVDGDSAIRDVHIILNFDEENPSASIKLISYQPISVEAIRGIQNAVSKSVSNLAVDDIVIIDKENQIISERTVEI